MNERKKAAKHLLFYVIEMANAAIQPYIQHHVHIYSIFRLWDEIKRERQQRTQANGADVWKCSHCLFEFASHFAATSNKIIAQMCEQPDIIHKSTIQLNLRSVSIKRSAFSARGTFCSSTRTQLF